MKKNILNNIKKIKGINIKTITKFRKILGLNTYKKKVIQTTYQNILALKKLIRLNKIDQILNISIKKRILHLINLKTFRGIRHKHKYPVRGQRTRTNAKTQKKLKLF